jgi:hypothetical protein
MKDTEATEEKGQTRRSVLKAGAVAAGAAAVGPIQVARGETSSGEAELSLNADMPANTSLTLVIREDSTNDGIPNTSETVDVLDGDRTYKLPSFNGTTDNEYNYWVEPASVDNNKDATFKIYPPITITLPDGEDSGDTDPGDGDGGGDGGEEGWRDVEADPPDMANERTRDWVGGRFIRAIKEPYMSRMGAALPMLLVGTIGVMIYIFSGSVSIPAVLIILVGGVTFSLVGLPIAAQNLAILVALAGVAAAVYLAYRSL